MVHRFWYESTKTSEALSASLNQRYTSDRQISGKMSPSGRISIGAVPAPKLLKADRVYEEERERTTTIVQKRWDAEAGIVSEEKTIVEKESSLGLSAERNHHKPDRARYGLGGITPNGRSRVYEGASLLHRRYRGRLGFYTLTCPYTDGSLIYEFNRNISEITRRWFQELRRWYGKYKITFSYVAVLEIQPERYEESGVPVIHIHYIAPCYRPGTWEWILSATEIRYLWMRTLSTVLGVEADTASALDAQVVKKSASGYLAKYIAKGYSPCEWIASIAPSQLPKQWWSMSANVRAAIKKLTTQISQALAEWWFGGNNFSEGDPFHLTYRRDIYVQWKGQELRVGMSAQMSAEGVARMTDPSAWMSAMFSL